MKVFAKCSRNSGILNRHRNSLAEKARFLFHKHTVQPLKTTVQLPGATATLSNTGDFI